jgi:hypothetical protein
MIQRDAEGPTLVSTARAQRRPPAVSLLGVLEVELGGVADVSGEVVAGRERLADEAVAYASDQSDVIPTRPRSPDFSP